MELSRVFGTINPDPLIAKSQAYGFSKDGLKLLYTGWAIKNAIKIQK